MNHGHVILQRLVKDVASVYQSTALPDTTTEEVTMSLSESIQQEG